ncbi:hypothetical protein BDV18DRAFT_167672 [Aspergillus unguis]
MTRSRNVRLYRACQRCRQRKLKCDPTTSPDGARSSCQQCCRAGNECILAGSRRGGDFSMFRRPRHGSSTPVGRADTTHAPTAQAEYREKAAENPIYAELTNPGDALQILARLAANDQRQHPNAPAFADRVSAARRGYSEAALPAANGMMDITQPPVAQSTVSAMELLVISVLGTDLVDQLLHRYAMNYHTFCPLVPKRLLSATDMRRLAVDEPFLLVVVLTIASKDEAVYLDTHRHCCQYLKQHLLDILIAAPSTLNVGSVEGLLLLAEWVPHLQMDTSSHSYLLRLDKASFREPSAGEPQELENRKRLAWIFVYIADRQISVRMGQSFWSRGPSLSTHFTAKDFPSLCLSADAEHNYASVLQASIELTQLLHNVHDILYSSKERQLQMVRRGDYNRYLDDFRCSLSAWQGRWGDLKASPQLSSTLCIVKEYIRLYVNAFAFQSILSRAVRESHTVSGGTISEAGTTTLDPKRPLSVFPQGITSTPEGAYVLEALDASREILIVTSQANPESHLRYMPFRFYVYTVYSAVFLYKAQVFGALGHAEKIEVALIVEEYIRVLEQAATNDYHVASRLASLLKRMWMSDTGKKYSSPMGMASPAVDHSGMDILPGHFEALQNINMIDRQAHPDAAIGAGVSGPASIATPNFNLFCPEFSSLESELVGLGMGPLDFPI